MTSFIGSTLAVTGAGGFVGRHVVATLAPLFGSVHAILGPLDSLPEWPANVRVLRLDITCAEKVQHALVGVDAVVHLAGLPGVAGSFNQAQLYSDVHVGGTANVLQALAPATRLIYLSSAEVYGQPTLELVAERSELAPLSPYGAAKCGAEQMVGSFVRSAGIPAVILRPFSIFGAGQNPGSLLASVFDQLRCAGSNSQMKVLVHDAAPVRDYISVTDVVRGIECALRLPVEDQGCDAVFNLCSGMGLSVAQLVRQAGKAAGKSVRVVQRDTSDRPVAAMVEHLVGDPKKALESLGWCASEDFQESLRQAYQS